MGNCGGSICCNICIEFPFPLIILGAAAIGYFGGRYAPQYFNANASHGSAQKSYGAALIDDETLTRAHAQFSWFRLMTVVICGALLWIFLFYILYTIFGWQHDYTQMAWFFTKAALLTFGGAYAILPYGHLRKYTN